MNAAIILARMDSKRLPGKPLMEIGGKPLISWALDELVKMKNIKIVLATTDRMVDLPLAEYAEKRGILCFRGDCENVAKRVSDCLNHYDIDAFARINADSPVLIKNMLKEGFEKVKDFDFVTNLYPRRFPYGISLEVIKSVFFHEQMKNFHKQDHFEHITSYFYDNILKFNVFSFSHHDDENYHFIKLTVDTSDDFKKMDRFLSRFNKLTDITPEEVIKKYLLFEIMEAV